MSLNAKKILAGRSESGDADSLYARYLIWCAGFGFRAGGVANDGEGGVADIPLGFGIPLPIR
jgi:hypothetical protein